MKHKWLGVFVPVLGLLLTGCSNSDDNGGSWTTPTLVQAADAGDGLDPQIAADAQGNATVVWRQADALDGGQRSNIWANRFTGGAWQTAERIETEDAGDALGPRIAVNARGDNLVVWYQFNGTQADIWSNRFIEDAWGTAGRVDPGSSRHASNPRVAMDARGDAVAVWQQAGENYMINIGANRFSGGSWRTAELLPIGNPLPATSPDVARNADGRTMVVWKHNEGRWSHAWAMVSEGSAWEPAQMVFDSLSITNPPPRISMNADGRAMAVWTEYDGEIYDAWARRYNGSAWAAAERIEADDEGHAGSPEMAMNDDGLAVAVWTRSDDERSSIWANRFDGSSWGEAEMISAKTAGNAGCPAVALNDAGEAVALWCQSVGAGTAIVASFFNGFSWQRPVKITMDDAADATRPGVVLTDNGDAVAVWEQNDGIRTRIWSSVLKTD